LTHDSQRQIPKVLVANVFACALGPSILVLIPLPSTVSWLPVITWPLAALWIVINAIVGAKTRLYLKMREALVNVIIAAVVSGALLSAVCFADYLLLHRSVEPVPDISQRPLN